MYATKIIYVDLLSSIVLINLGLELYKIKLIFKLFTTIHQLRGDRHDRTFYCREINWKENATVLKRHSKLSIISLKRITPIKVA